MFSIRHLVFGIMGAALAISGCANPPSASICANGIACPPGTQCAAAQQICIVGNCGNGLLDPGEQCDDGNVVDGDGCSHLCAIEVCGNHNLDPGEVCDDGNNVSGDGCSANCQSIEICGNSTVDVGEACDDGNTVSGDGCSADCKSTEVCGNGIKDIHELCDDGHQPGGCNDDCQGGTGCGDGSIDKDATGNPIEQCDDGNTADDDDCLSSKTSPATTCKIAKCGDGVRQVNGSRQEDCDPGVNGTPVEDATCNIDCTTASCGDGKVNRHFKPDGSHPEQCDNGPGVNNNSADCTASCQINVCGDGHQNTTIGPNHEDCDDGPSNGAVGDPCSTTCHLVNCGNGVLEQGEECDDGANNGANKRCNTSCKFNVCGDGQTLTGVEQCDDGVSGVRKDTLTCDDDCTFAVCGDGHLNMVAGEGCDDGANNGKLGDTCSVTCQLINCGNGVVEQGEECDDGANNGVNKRCNTSCKLNVCGDGHTLNGVEQCDDGVGGAKQDSLTCDDDCTFAVCGDGHLNVAAHEECDNGALNGAMGNTCDAFCHINRCGNGFVDFGEQCDPGTGAPATDSATCDRDCTAVVCGDALTNSVAGEACDDGALNGDPCGYNDPNCSRCNSTCTGHISPGGPSCGDGTINGPEVCDQGSLFNGTQCGYGSLFCLSGPTSTICKADCTGLIPNPNGPFCGDSVVQPQFNEQCDPGGGLTPSDVATCDQDCSRVICGDGHVNIAAGEACDDGSTDACGSCSADCQTPSVAATGTITAVGGGVLTNGETFTLNDGIHPQTVFEFVKGGGPASGSNIAVNFLNGDNSTTVRDAMVAAINGVGAGTLAITASSSSTADVSLVNTHIGTAGNVAIAVSDPNLVFTGMSGGTGSECANGVGCMTNADCASHHCVGAGSPRADSPGVCQP